MPRALGRSYISRFTARPAVGAGLAGRSPGGGLLANAMRVRLCCGLRLGAQAQQFRKIF